MICLAREDAAQPNQCSDETSALHPSTAVTRPTSAR